jgi:hypothetical protein
MEQDLIKPVGLDALQSMGRIEAMLKQPAHRSSSS